MDGTKANNAAELGLHDFKGRFFGFATYAQKATEIRATKEQMAELAAAMSDDELDTALLSVKTSVRRLEDVESVMRDEMRARLDAGREFAHFYLDSYPRSGAVDWVAIAKATGLSKEAARARFAGTTVVKSVKPKAEG